MKISPQVAMTLRQIMLMNFGFFGIQYSFGLQQTAINPIFSFLHADPSQLPILNMAGPITGLLVQPMIGAMSDRTWVPGLGRRRPYFLIGAIGCSLCLFIYPHVTALWVAVLLLWLLDISNNTAMEPFRAFIADTVPEHQQSTGFLDAVCVYRFGYYTGQRFPLHLPTNRLVATNFRSGYPVLGIRLLLYWCCLLYWFGFGYSFIDIRTRA